MRRADEREVHGHRLPAAERRHHAVLQHAQQPRLEQQRHIADLVEEQRAALGLADAPRGALLARAGEGAALIAEQLRFDQVLRQRSAVDRDERLVRARAAEVRRAREDLLADARLALQQQGDRLAQHLSSAVDRGLELRVPRVERRQRIAQRRRSLVGDLRRRPSDRRVAREVRGLHAQPDAAPAARVHEVRGAVLAQAPLAQSIERLGQHGVEAGGHQVRPAQPEQLERGGVGAREQAVLVHGQQALGDRAEALRQPMKPQAQAAPLPLSVARVEQPVLDHARRRAHQPERVRVIAAMITGDVQRAEHPPARVVDRHRCAGQEAIALEVVLLGVDDDWLVVGQRCADGVGAAVLLVPDRARPQRDALRPTHEVRVPLAVQQHPVGARQDAHAGAVAGLLVQKLHHRLRVRHELPLPLELARELRARGVRRAEHASVRLQPGVPAASPRARERRREELCGHSPRAEEQTARFA